MTVLPWRDAYGKLFWMAFSILPPLTYSLGITPQPIGRTKASRAMSCKRFTVKSLPPTSPSRTLHLQAEGRCICRSKAPAYCVPNVASDSTLNMKIGPALAFMDTLEEHIGFRWLLFCYLKQRQRHEAFALPRYPDSITWLLCLFSLHGTCSELVELPCFLSYAMEATQSDKLWQLHA
jgi:hypothetical protein